MARAHFLTKLGRHDRALEIWDHALERFPDDPIIIEHMILTQIGFDERETAEDILKKALESKTKRAFYWLRMGRVAQHVWPMPDRSEISSRMR